jgi:hypothetical protein
MRASPRRARDYCFAPDRPVNPTPATRAADERNDNVRLSHRYMLGTICGLLSVSDPASQEYQNMSDLLNRYIREVAHTIERRVRMN